MRGYKITDQDMRTRDNTQWRLGEKKTLSGEGEMPGKGFYHAYEDALVGVFMNPIHSSVSNPRMFEVEAGGVIRRHGQVKFGASEMTLIREIPVPQVTTDQRVRFGILCAIAAIKAAGL